MNKDEGLPERLGQKINELDIDFSRFTLAGWFVVLMTLGSGIAVGWLVYAGMPQVDGMSRGRALVLGVSGLTTAIVVFLVSRNVLKRLGISIVRTKSE